MKSSEKERALIAILDSIALEEKAIAGLIKAETEKLYKIIENIKHDACPQDLKLVLEVQRSIKDLLEQINRLEQTLKKKAKLAIGALPPLPPQPPKPPRPCTCRCIPCRCRGACK